MTAAAPPRAEGTGAFVLRLFRVEYVLWLAGWMFFVVGLLSEWLAGPPSADPNYVHFTADSGQLFGMAACLWVWRSWIKATPPRGAAPDGPEGHHQGKG